MKDDIRFDLAQFYPMKAVIEQILGRNSFQKLKDHGTLTDWKTESQKLLDAITLSISTTVQISDDDWNEEVDAVIKLGKSHVQDSNTIADLFSSLAATFARLSFLQKGFLPNRYSKESIRLVSNNWKLDVFRSVQYVQNENQKQKLKQYKESRKSKEK